jgi:demethylmenaquinone methyltransferase/2-methoxy-6-polyprenyl-1,4-benzoquinol methylase
MSSHDSTLQSPTWTPADAVEGKAQYVQQMFDRIASTYDLLNDCISFGMHRQWKNTACKRLNLAHGNRVLDVCTGTGDLLGRLARQVGPSGEVVGLDFSAEMLEVARKRYPQSSALSLVQGDAMALPFEDNTFDGAIVAFGLRNVADIEKTVREMARVVKPGGWVVNLDTNPNPVFPGFKFYFSTIMPLIGQALSMDKKAYHYLSESTWHFLSPKQLGQVFETAGLTQVRVESLSLGAVSIQLGQVAAENAG